MLSLASQKRNKEEKVQALRNQGVIPGVMYGAKIEAAMVKVDGKEFKKIYEEVGKSSLINLESPAGTTPVLIREVQREQVRDRIIQVACYKPLPDVKLLNIAFHFPYFFSSSSLFVLLFFFFFDFRSFFFPFCSFCCCCCGWVTIG